MPARVGTCGEAGVRALLARTDAYFSKVGLLPVLLPLPIQGDCLALKRGLLRSCILCSDSIQSQVSRALTQQNSGRSSGEGPSLDGVSFSGDPSPPHLSSAASPHYFTRISSGSAQAPPEDCLTKSPLDPVERALLPAKILREKLRIYAVELQDKETHQAVGPPILTREELGTPYLQKVVECIDSSRTEGVLFLLCERRSCSISNGPYKASLDTFLNATAAQRAERQDLLAEEQQKQPKIEDFSLGAVAGGLVTVTATGQRQLMSFFCIEELPDDARHQLVRVLAVRVMALAFLWPSVFCNTALHSDDDLRAPGPSLLHFPRPARDFLCLPSGLQLSRHFETEDDADFNHTDQVRGCACVKRMQRRVQQQAGRARQDIKGPLPDNSPLEGPPVGSSAAGGGTDRPLNEWHEFWAVSKRRFYATWAQRATQLVPDDPANSLLEAFDLPLRFPHEEDNQKSPDASSPGRRRGASRGKRSRGRGLPTSDATSAEVPHEPSCTYRASSRSRGRSRVSQSRQQQNAASGVVADTWEAAPSVASALPPKCIDPTRPVPLMAAPGSSGYLPAVKREGTAVPP